MVTPCVTRHLGRAGVLIAVRGMEPVGAAACSIRGSGGCELLSLAAAEQRRGVGTALLQAVESWARDHACRRVWLVTRNDQVDALRLYQRRGYRLVTVHPGAVAVADASTLNPGR